jgi:hypothetical protein
MWLLGSEIVRDPLSKNPSQKRADGVVQGVGPEFKPQHHKKKKEVYVTNYDNFSGLTTQF